MCNFYETLYLMSDARQYDLYPNPRSKWQVTEDWKYREWPSKSVFSAIMHAIKRILLNFDTPGQCLNFNWTDFWYSSSFSVMWPSDFCHLGNFRWYLINFVLFYSRVFRMADRMDLLSVGTNPRWRASRHFENFKWLSLQRVIQLTSCLILGAYIVGSERPTSPTGLFTLVLSRDSEVRRSRPSVQYGSII